MVLVVALRHGIGVQRGTRRCSAEAQRLSSLCNRVRAGLAGTGARA